MRVDAARRSAGLIRYGCCHARRRGGGLMQRQFWKESWEVGTWGSGMGAAMQGV